MANYTYPGTLTVKNKLGARAHEELERLEAPFVEARDIEIALELGPRGQFDVGHLKAIHHHLFQDVFEWAGHTRDEHVTLSDGSIASEPAMRKLGGGDFLVGPRVPDALDRVATNLRDSGYLRDLSREEFAMRAADVMADINAIHPFREGNGRTQRVFMRELAKQAGYELDFDVISQERMIQASIAANEQQDPAMMRRLFDEISNPGRVAALRKAIEYLEHQNFNWNDYYISTTEPAHNVEMTMVGMAGENFMARTASQILIGRTSDLHAPYPERGEQFSATASENAWDDSRDVRRRQQEETDKRQAPAEEFAAREERRREGDHHPPAAGETKGATERERQNRFTPPGEDRPPTTHGQDQDRGGRGGRGGRSR